MKSFLQLKYCVLLLSCFIVCGAYTGYAQPTTIVSAGTYTGSGSASTAGNGLSFSVRNNNPIGIKITQVSALHFALNNGSTSYTLWYTTVPAQATGNTATVPSAGWTNYGTSPVQGPPDGVKQMFNNMSLVVPANTIMRIVLTFQTTSPYTYICTGVNHTGGPIFSSNGVDLMSGSNGISNGLYGFGSPANLTNSTYRFLGSITFEPEAIPCVDTVTSAVVIGPKQVCPNKGFGLSVGLQNGLMMSGLTYQWQYSPDGISWSNYTGVPNAQQGGLITDSIVAERYYRCKLRCNTDNKTYTTPAHKVDIAPFYYCYCDNSMDADTGANLGNVTIVNSNNYDTVFSKATLVTGTGMPIYNNDQADKTYTSYHDSLATPCLYRDTNYIFDISQIHSENKFIKGVLQAYIDYNRDGIYNPNTERVFVHAMDGLGNPPQKYRSGSTIPSTAESGLTGMRVILSEDTIKTGPCGILAGAGEVEDYIVEICERPCDAPVDAGLVVSTDTSMCGGYEYTLTDTTYEKKRSGFTRSWQLSGDNISWMNIANSLNKDTLERVFTDQPLYYRLRTICGATHDTNYSQPTLINLKPSYKCYCYSKATGGLFSDTSDIGGVTIAGYSSNSGGPHLLNNKAVYPRTDFTDIKPIEMFADSLYDFYVYHTMKVVEHGDAKVTIFMDFNNNHEYDIPNERIYTGYTSIGNHTLIDNVLIPYNAITDVPTGMRVIINNDVGPNIPSDEACGGYTSGETEDYILIFRRKWAQNVNETMKVGGFNVHPNPTTGKFYVQFQTNSSIENVDIRVTSVAGQVVQHQSYKHDKGMFNQELDMSGQPAGVYFVELQADGQRMMKKLIVQ